MKILSINADKISYKAKMKDLMNEREQDDILCPHCSNPIKVAEHWRIR